MTDDLPQLDADGHLVNLDDWNHTTAQHLADSLDVQLTDWHWTILAAMQQFYRDYGYAPATRPLIRYLQQNVSPEISNAMLMQGFNTGLVARHVSRVAGLPKPANCL